MKETGRGPSVHKKRVDMHYYYQIIFSNHGSNVKYIARIPKDKSVCSEAALRPVRFANICYEEHFDADYSLPVRAVTNIYLCYSSHKHISVLQLSQTYICVTAITNIYLCYSCDKHISVLQLSQTYICVTAFTNSRCSLNLPDLR